MFVLALSAAACGGGGDSDGKEAAAKESKKATPARPLQVERDQHQIAWTDLQKESHVLRAAPRQLARGSAADLEGVRLDDDLKGKVPYYLTVSYTNKGKKRLSQPAPERDFSVASVDGQPGDRINFYSSSLSKDSGLPDACSKAAPKSLDPGRTATVCTIIMMPKDRPPAAVSYTGTDAKGQQSDPVIWKAGSGQSELPSGVLPLNHSAESAVKDAKNRTVKVTAAPRSVRRGKAADLSRFNLSPDQKKKVPYYVTVVYRNNGSHALLPDMNEQLELHGTSGQQAQKLTLIDLGGPGVTQCAKAVPNKLVKPKASVKVCSIHLLSRTDPPASLVFGSEDSSANAITWQATARKK